MVGDRAVDLDAAKVSLREPPVVRLTLCRVRFYAAFTVADVLLPE